MDRAGPEAAVPVATAEAQAAAVGNAAEAVGVDFRTKTTASPRASRASRAGSRSRVAFVDGG